LENCATSCDRVAKELAGVTSFFDLSAMDIDGNLVRFEQFKGDMTILTNLAAYCVHGEARYKGLVKLKKQLEHHTGRVNLLSFPCRQHGPVPEEHDEIADFVTEFGVALTTMGKMSLPKTSLLYRWLNAGPDGTGWHFAHYSVIGPDGQPMELEGTEHDPHPNLLKMEEMMKEMMDNPKEMMKEMMDSIASKDL
jgi:glutathione peroxidase